MNEVNVVFVMFVSFFLFLLGFSIVYEAEKKADSDDAIHQCETMDSIMQLEREWIDGKVFMCINDVLAAIDGIKVVENYEDFK